MTLRKTSCWVYMGLKVLAADGKFMSWLTAEKRISFFLARFSVGYFEYNLAAVNIRVSL